MAKAADTSKADAPVEAPVSTPDSGQQAPAQPQAQPRMDFGIPAGCAPEEVRDRILQRRAAIEAVFDIRELPVWGPSAVQPGDWGTREGLERRPEDLDPPIAPPARARRRRRSHQPA